MDTQIRVHLEVELDAAAEPVAGWVAARGAELETFIGWIELATALERARAAAREQAECAVEPAP